MKNKIFRDLSKKEHITLTAVGIFIIALSIILFVNCMNIPRDEIGNIVMLLESPAIGVIGFIMILINFNYKNKYFLYTLIFLSGVIAALIITIIKVRFFVASILVDCLIFIIIVAFFNAFVTAFTLIISSSIWVVIAAIIISRMGSYANQVMYICITLSLITYLLYGCKLNKFILKKYNQKASDEYNRETLRNNLTGIYIVLFILLNVSGVLYITDNQPYNVINNSFLTIITILSIKNWNDIVKFKISLSKKEDINMNEQG